MPLDMISAGIDKTFDTVIAIVDLSDTCKGSDWVFRQ